MKKDYLKMSESQAFGLESREFFDFSKGERKSTMHENRFEKSEKNSENQRNLKENEE